MSDIRQKLDDCIEHAFGARTFRSAYIIDDEFPTYSKAVRGTDNDATDAGRQLAGRLHDTFRKVQVPCDVDDWKHDATFDETHFLERVRKSDFVVLDYNLKPNDIRTSIGIVLKLADSTHFNNVIIYTANTDLRRVWREVAAAARGGWMTLAEMTASKKLQQPEVEALSRIDVDSLDSIDDENLELLITGASSETLDPAIKRIARELPKELKRNAGVLLELRAAIDVRAMLSQEFVKSLKGVRRVAGSSGNDGTTPWLQVGNCFIAFATKPSEGRAPVSDTPLVLTEPEEIIEAFHKALRAWRPSAVQIAIAEIQNRLELSALATDMKSMNNARTQAALSDYVLEHMSADQPTQEDSEAWTYDGSTASENLLSLLVDNVRAYLSTDADLSRWVSDMLEQECADHSWRGGNDRLNIARKMARDIVVTDSDVRFKLNHLLSFEPVVGHHLTTGTLFRDPLNTKNVWICLAPACDMVPRRAAARKAVTESSVTSSGVEVKVLPKDWSESVSPYKPFMAAKLNVVELAKGVRSGATDGRHLFMEIRQIEGGPNTDEKLALEVVTSKGTLNQEMFFAVKGGLVERSATKVDGKFFASRISAADDDLGKPVTSQFEVIGQLRAPYANRLLQNMGQHMSRIGVDFIKFA